jgi:hypothetical protein
MSFIHCFPCLTAKKADKEGHLRFWQLLLLLLLLLL